MSSESFRNLSFLGKIPEFCQKLAELCQISEFFSDLSFGSNAQKKACISSGFFCALLEKLRSAKNSGFRHNSGIFSENSGIFAENPDIFLKKCKFDGIEN